MRFTSLGSGSRGNATLVEAGATCLMIDCGFSTIEVERRLTRLEYEAENISGILVTHEHSDHLQGVGRFARKYSLPVWMTSGTYTSCQQEIFPEINLISSHEDFSIQDIQIQPFPVPHDAREPCQFVFDDARHKFAILTDTGSITAHIEEMINGVDALMLECNHDMGMLMQGSYSQALKERVGGQYGHMNNQQAAELLASIDHSRLQVLVAAHLSHENNSEVLVRSALDQVLEDGQERIRIADQKAGLDWVELR